jgi:acyl-coenzyme A thioesterase PaaI-like protein
VSVADSPLPGSDGTTATLAEGTRERTLNWEDPVATAAAGAELSGLDYMRALVAGELPPPPIAVTMRMGPIELEEGRVVFAGEPGEEHYNPIGMVHGGYAATILDSALGCAVHTTLPVGTGYTSLGLEVSTCGRSPATPAASSARAGCSTAAASRRRPRRR